MDRSEKSGPDLPLDGVAHLEERQGRRDEREQESPQEPEHRVPAAGRDQARRHDQPGERAQEADQAEAEVVRQPERGDKVPEAVACPGVEAAGPEPADEPEGDAHRPEEMPEAASPRAGREDLDEGQHGHDRQDHPPALGDASSRVDQLGRLGIRAGQPQGSSESMVPRTSPPTLAALRTPIRPSRSRPVRATRADDSRK